MAEEKRVTIHEGQRFEGETWYRAINCHKQLYNISSRLRELENQGHDMGSPQWEKVKKGWNKFHDNMIRLINEAKKEDANE